VLVPGNKKSDMTKMDAQEEAEDVSAYDRLVTFFFNAMWGGASITVLIRNNFWLADKCLNCKIKYIYFDFKLNATCNIVEIWN
jgi:hypothetical protein